MKKPNSLLWPVTAALVLAGCATQTPPKFDVDPLAGNTPSPALFSSQPAASTSTPIVRPATPTTPAAAATTPAPAPTPAAPTAVTVTRTLAPDLLRPSDGFFTLGPGDQLDIETLGNVPYHAIATVGLDGKIYYSFLPGIDVWGMTLGETKSRIEEELSKYITQPQVSVSLKAVGSKYIWLLGRVTKPGIYPLTGSMSLLEALSLAGGTATSASAASYNTQDLADLRHSFVMRDGKPLPIDFVRLLKGGDMSQNIYLKADDFVYIPSSLSQQVYVLGAVGVPHAVPYSDQMTVLSAIASAGGVIKNAYQTHVGIVRGSLSQPQLIVADYASISHGKAQDVLVEPGDIVYVPLTPYHVITDYADFIATTFARAWSANLGVRAVQGSTTVGVSLPVGTVGGGVGH
ncbi:MAG TPA: SLBB domain-containing protein [Verrucomicrobiae bacterium]|nr:SLBB domain-containing protein [Verrucomicrobiae bacterium]